MKNIEYSKWIKQYRVKMQMTQKEYADFLNVNLRTVQNWETRGTSKTTMALIIQIHIQEIEIEELKKKLEDNNMIFTLEK